MLKVVYGRYFKGIVLFDALIFLVLLYLIIFKDLGQQQFVRFILCFGLAQTTIGMSYLTLKMVHDHKELNMPKDKDDSDDN